LVTDSGADDGDGLTNVADLAGTRTAGSPVTIEVSLNGINFFDLEPLGGIDDEGNVAITAAILTQINGGALPNGTLLVTLRATDAADATSFRFVRFNLKTSLPQLDAAFDQDTGTFNNDGITTDPAFSGVVLDPITDLFDAELIITGP